MAREPRFSSRVQKDAGVAARTRAGTLKALKPSSAIRQKIHDDYHVKITQDLRGLRHSADPSKRRLLDPSRELEVLKCITLRESYLERLQHLAKSIEREASHGRGQVQALPPGMVDLLDLLRLITLDTVEAISFWRLSQATPTPAPFEWNGANYLMKILHDCDFLDRVEALRRWLGFSPTRNPFLMPEDATTTALSLLEKEGLPASYYLNATTDFHVGMQPWPGPFQLAVGDYGSTRVAKANARNRKRRKACGQSHLAPYTVPVINDPSLVPAWDSLRSPTCEAIPLHSSSLLSKNDQSLRSPTHASVDVGGLVPNLISRADVERVKVAKQVLIQEEQRTRAAAAASVSPDDNRASPPVTSATDASTMSRKNPSALPSLSRDLRLKRVSRSGTNNSNQSSRRSSTARAGCPQGLPERSNEEFRALVTTAAGLVGQAPAELHPGLGPVLLRADFPGGELHPKPFAHTEGNEHVSLLKGREASLDQETPGLPVLGTADGGCSIGPLLSNTPTGVATRCGKRSLFHLPAKRQELKTPVRTGDNSSPKTLKISGDGDRTSREWCMRRFAPTSERVGPSRSSLYSPRKAGAELTALTAAGTSGRRQPPLREARLQRLERDVLKHSAELRELLKTEQHLRRSVACQGRVDAYGDGLLKAKQREIEWKTVDLDGKRDELRWLRMVQQHELDSDKALEMERRRRHLGEGQTLPEDNKVAEALEDNSALAVQRRFRGNRGRAFAISCRDNINEAATTIQRTVRCVWDRRITRHKFLLHASAKSIQAAIRMFIVKKRYFRLLRNKRELLACSKLQRVCRGMNGRRRAAARRAMKAAASKALDWVSLDALQPKHLQELSNAISGALFDPTREFPPSGVLGVIRVALAILDDAGAETGMASNSHVSAEVVTFETAFGRVVRSSVSASNLTWEMASRVLGRPHRLLRRMRAFASGLGAPSDPTPTRLLRLSPEVIKLLDAYQGDPSWSEKALRSIKEGGIASTALVGWTKEVGNVFREQHHVHDFLRDAQPAWLRKVRSFQRRKRALELAAESCRCAIEVARDYRDHLENSGYAYGDPLMAYSVLEARLENANAAVGDLESRRIAFLATQATIEAAAGSSLKESAEFAEREASVAARAEAVALRLDRCNLEDLADLARKKQHWENVSREMRRRFHVWERRCQEENRPLLKEWVPPTAGQVNMAQALGVAHGWEAITFQGKKRLVKEAGGRRFIKGLASSDMERWRRVCEGLEACREDAASGETMLAEDVRRYEHEIAASNKACAAEKVLSAKWDNAGQITQELERQEDVDAARDERRTALGVVLPPGIFDDTSRPPGNRVQQSKGSSRRPTLLLLSHSLPAAVRARVRASLDRNAPDLFGLHLVGQESLPSLAQETRTRDLGFLDPCREQGRPPATGPRRWEEEHCSRTLRSSFGGTQGPDGPHRIRTAGCAEITSGDQPMGSTRASLVQATLSVGKSVSLDVTTGPGLWTWGHFLRDLESILVGLDGCGDCVWPSNSADRGGGPRVILVDGHDRNRSGGGVDIDHGTEGFVTKASLPAARTTGSDASARPGTVMATSALRAKSLLEEAGQCLQDLSVTHGATLVPFQLLDDDANFSMLSAGTPIQEFPSRNDYGESTEPEGSSGTGGNSFFIAPQKGGSHSRDLLLAACCMMLHPDCRYDVGEGHEVSVQERSSEDNLYKEAKSSKVKLTPQGDSNAKSLVSHLAETCRRELAACKSARQLADVLREFDPVSITLDTAVALRYIARNHAWPKSSPRPNFAECPTSASFATWIIAAASALVEIVLGQGGNDRPTSLPLEQSHQSCPLARRIDVDETVDMKGSTAERGGDGVPQLFKAFVPETRARGVEFLEGLEGSLIDETITVVDDDSTYLFEDETGRRRGRHYRASEVFVVIMNAVLKPFRVYEEVDRPITLQEIGNSLSSSGRVKKFRTIVSRAFGSIYVQVESPTTESEQRPGLAMSIARDEDLILLLSANWMETHDLPSLCEPRDESAVWRALVDALVLYHLPDEETLTLESSETNAVGVMKITSTFANARKLPCAVLHDRVGDVLACKGSTASGSRIEILSFRHSRRLTLKTHCRLLGHKVPVAVFEESRGDFWCEARLTLDRKADITVGALISKKCISWFLEENHPMHMQTILDPSDLREISVFIADRLKLRRVGYARFGLGVPRNWLTAALTGGVGSNNVGISKRNEAACGESHYTQSGGGFRLSLRKRGVGQVVFSRWVSFRVQGSGHHARKEHHRAGGIDDRRYHGKGSPRKNVVLSRQAFLAQRVVTVKEIAHRGERGELRVEAYDPDFGGCGEPFTLTTELTAALVAGRKEDIFSHGHEGYSPARYWRDALLWRFKLMFPGPGWPLTDVETLADGRNQLMPTADSVSYSSLKSAPSVNNIDVDLRSPLLSLRGVSVRLEGLASDRSEKFCGASLEGNAVFDVVVLGKPGIYLPDKCKEREAGAEIELVVTHLQTMSCYSFQIPASVFVEEVLDGVMACLTTPTSLSTELAQPIALDLQILARKWLSFSQDGGRGITVTLRFPGMESVTTSPYVALRSLKSSQDNEAGSRNRCKYSKHAFVAEGRGIAVKRGSFTPMKKCMSRDSERVEVKNASAPGSDGSRQYQHPMNLKWKNDNVATLKPNPRNERMIFRHQLQIIALNISDKKVREGQPRVRNALAVSGKENRETVRVELVISVYEVFLTGQGGRVERQLRFCARDEKVRPAIETSAMVPRNGTCEVIERGDIRRLVTDGLEIRRVLDERGRCVRMQLNVISGERNATRLRGCKRDEPIGISKIEEGTRVAQNNSINISVREGASTTADYELGEKSTQDKPGAFSYPQQHGRSTGVVATFDHGYEVETNARIGVELGSSLRRQCSSYKEDASAQDAPHPQPSAEIVNEVSRKEVAAASKTADGDETESSSGRLCSSTDKVVDGEGYVQDSEVDTFHFKGKENKRTVSHGTKIFDDWLCITGIRLHVLCFHEEIIISREMGVTTRSTDINRTHVDGSSNSWDLGERGESASLPRGSCLRFVACEPVTGRRTGVELLVDDFCANSSSLGGVVEADLLLAERRPALAKAVALKLRLVFEADGSYKMILPLPKDWKRRA